MRRHIVYNTGRVYNNQQFLDIVFEEQDAVELNLDDVEVFFHDASRHISGVVVLWGLDMDTNANIGRAVLREYDAGRYRLV
jgi:hypothetical protein